MLNIKTLGIIFANMHDDNVSDMTEIRSMASLPFGGRYRLIDFYLSSLVAAGVTKVGVIAKNNYQSLMDHLGSGRAWDLSRKREGLSIFPPFATSQERYYHGRIEALYNILDYIEKSSVNYIVMMDCDHVVNLDFEEIIDSHINTGADVTMVCRSVPNPNWEMQRNCVCVHTDANGRINDMIFNRIDNDCLASMNVFVVAKDRLVEMVEEAQSRMQVFFERDLLLRNLNKLKLQSFRYDGYCRRIYNNKSYFDANMDLLSPENMHALFLNDRPVYTKVRDDAPVRYGLDAKVQNSLVADGCVVLGNVENCLLFRGVYIAEGASVKNSIIMQDNVVGKNAQLSYIITDKDVTISDDRSLMGHENYPLYVKKYSVI